MTTVRNSRLLWTIPSLIIICLLSFPAYAQYGGGTTASALTNTYVFLPGQSTVVQTGGIAGVHWTYSVEGLFQLTVDPNAGTASFVHVDANATDDSPLQRTLDPNEVFNMTTLVGAVLDDTTISFTGKAADGSDVLITVTIEDDLAYLDGQTIPPPNTADFFLFNLDAVAQRKYGGGTGEPNDPYQIATAGDLMLLGDTPEDYDKHFILTADIDLDPNLPGRKVFDKAVIAPDTNDATKYYFEGTPFTGVFDGNSHMISHLTVEGISFLGLFGQLGSGARIANVDMEAVEVSGTTDYIGGLVGFNQGSITTSYSTSTVSGGWGVGGLVGYNSDDGKIANCYSNSKVAGETHVGGFVGYNDAIIFTCYSTGSISGTAVVVGLVGDNTGIIINSYARCSVSGNSIVGGFVGSNEYIQTWDASGNPKAPGEILNCYSTSSVSGNEDVGGLVGSGPIRKVFNSFWDINTSGQTFSAGGSGKATTEMRNIQTYLDVNWDFVGETENGLHETWQIAEEGGYPTLAILSGYIPPQLRGQGTHEEPYLISDTRELGAIIHYSPYAHYRLTASIDLSEIRWGMAVVPWFAGTFDGNDFTISNLKIEGGGYLGLFGLLQSESEVKNLGVVDVNITGSGYYVGGVVGENDNGSITMSYGTGKVSGEGLVGGLVGINRGSVTTSYSTSAVTGSVDVGGLVGNNGGSLSDCYNTGMVMGGAFVGGMVGYNRSSLTHCYSESAVNGDSDVGGLVGFNTSSITKSYSTGSVTGIQYAGGVVGRNLGYFTHCFWDIQASGQATSAGGTGKTTAEMQTVGTFLEAGWDFVDETENGTEDIWWILEGQDYPRLWWELIEENSVVIPEN